MSHFHPDDALLQADSSSAFGATAADGYVDLLGEQYYCIHHYDQMPPFFMSIISSADHWLFVSSTGGLTAGRINADSAIFPYYTDDKITENYVNTGPVACLFVQRGAQEHRWEPFRGQQADPWRIERRIYKNVIGDKLIFEESNLDLGISYRYAWRTSDRFGFVRTVWLQNQQEQTCTVRLVDGVQNLLPFGATTQIQTTMSNLLDGYKRSELDSATGLGIFALSATLTDRAEPSESLKATVAWQVGLRPDAVLLSSNQLASFRQGHPVSGETDSKGRRGAYLLSAQLTLSGGEERSWHLITDCNQDHSQIIALGNLLQGDAQTVAGLVEQDIAQGSAALTALVASADGLQSSADVLTTAHHFANAAFNIMRGGVFVDNCQVEVRDFVAFLRVRNRQVYEKFADFMAALPLHLTIDDLCARANATGAPDLIRLCYEYLPLSFGRRHGDPSRPWNRFSINLRQPDGTRRLDFEGNWRDIFQNWEPLAYSFPSFIEGMIARFLNATTADGYNPYRVTRAGIEWEVPEPNNPWANIGYWSDHQIIYLQKLLEIAEQFHPNSLQNLWEQRIFSHADVPYRLRPYAQTVEDPYNTIDFDWEREDVVKARVATLGADGKLLTDGAGAVFHSSLAEKLLVLILAKLVNLVPEGGVWMNTQRPEWNDANNALVGKGLSVVTVAYLRRTLVFCRGLLASAPASLTLTAEVKSLMDEVAISLAAHKSHLAAGFDPGQRRRLMDALGQAGSAYRSQIYSKGFSGAWAAVKGDEVLSLLDLALAYVDQTLRTNRRPDGLFHSYNILHLRADGATIGRLYPMLEGQVAVLSSGLLDSSEALAVCQSLRTSPLYRADQHSYILYPDRELPGFLAKNRLTREQIASIPLAEHLIERGDRSILLQDANGDYHFHGNFRNAQDVAAALARLDADAAPEDLLAEDGPRLLTLFENTFDHASFTGRSGTFFAYEGLGSIYWHMVSKLLLAVQENFWWAQSTDSSPAILDGLAAAYYDIRAGIGFNKSAPVYGAFPTDPYSHTPKGQGAKQPGMTGQVKEELLTRWGELGVRIQEGAIVFDPVLLRPQEFHSAPTTFDYVNLNCEVCSLPLPANSLAFTLCQTPVILSPTGSPQIELLWADGQPTLHSGNRLEPALAQHLFRRDGRITQLTISF